MSCLRLYAPVQLSVFVGDDVESTSVSEVADHSEAVLLPFVRATRFKSITREPEILARSRMIHQNRCCPECGRASVDMISSADALMSRDHMPVPGSGRIFGFRCASCDHEWAAIPDAIHIG